MTTSRAVDAALRLLQFVDLALKVQVALLAVLPDTLMLYPRNKPILNGLDQGLHASAAFLPTARSPFKLPGMP